MKTIKLVCGYSFALLYCNLYFWKTINKKGTFGRPKYYDKVKIPDYTIKRSYNCLYDCKNCYYNCFYYCKF